MLDRRPGEDAGCWWLLVRRNRITGELAFYRCYAPQIVPLRELVRVAGRRWTIEESFQTAKGLAGLDEHQVRCWTSWQRWTLLCWRWPGGTRVMRALAFGWGGWHCPSPPEGGMGRPALFG